MRNVLNGVAVCLAALGLFVPVLLLGETLPPRLVAEDVSLQKGGTLLGQVIDPEGNGLAGVPISLRSQDRQLTIRSQENGRFAVSGLRAGVYQIAAAEARGVYRLWATGTAPPAAGQALVLTAGRPVSRGQHPGPWKTFLTNPLLIGGAVATAVAVPVAVHNYRQGPPASP